MKKFLKIFFVSIIVLAIGGWIFAKVVYYPKYSGALQLENLKDEVSVIYDENGVPHIEAENQEDAYRALGYVHAQDRLWQMELMRRITAGRLSEIFGKDFIKIDKFMGSLGVEEASQKTIKALDKTTDSYKYMQSYLNGINQFMDKGATPVEFHLLGIEKEKYTIEDVYNVYGYIAFSFAYAYKHDPLLNEINEKLGSTYAKELMIASGNTTLIKGTDKKITAKFSSQVNALIEKLPVPLLEGSNSWVLGAKRTKNNKVIFANDPHIQYSQPSVWYQAHIKTPNYEMYGFNMALTPFPLLGHNKEYAYGITMFENDDTDFYIEENNPTNPLQYKTENGYVDYKIINKTIKVKGEEDVKYQLKVSRHGPIMNDALDNVNDSRPLAMHWIYTSLENKAIEVSYKLSHSDSIAEVRGNVADLHAPGLNIMYGDAKDNIAMYGAAKLYKYRDSLNRQLYLNGASGADEIKEYIDFCENTQPENPKSNFVYSANNQHDSIAGILYPGYYLAEDRAKRITQLIEPNEDFTTEDVKKMMMDVTSSVAPSIVTDVKQILKTATLSDKEKSALSIISAWDGSYRKESNAPTIYTRFIYEFQKATFADEMREGFTQYLELPLELHMRAIQMKRLESVWWDDIRTKDTKETREIIVANAFQKAVKFLENQLGSDMQEWKWKKVYSVEHPHPFGKKGGILKYVFSVGPFETDGGRGVINNIAFTMNEEGIYKGKSGPSTRRIVDFSDVENSFAILPTGQSGNRFSPFYKDQADKYLNGEYVKMYINPKDYKESKNKLILSPSVE